ncbi:MAG: UDP-N-acetylmuramoyl-L-alanyl-D-glutamate--2,6-diaminopimelate ligase [Planctomycetota bacterium]|nr:UDP-N-acetylmuramoyl-L-alanyl-D-glutamate--2,6-diaminopimelate ligase [Planctomycetota bacterium]
MQLGDLIEGLEITLDRESDRTARICDITEDSRTVMPGSLFIARPGTKVDGRKFIEAAIAADAAAILTDPLAARPAGSEEVAWLTTTDLARAEALLAERFFGAPASRLALAGVTGTNGKTTVAHLVHQLLNDSGVRCGLIGTVQVDDGCAVAKAAMTTPPALELSFSLARMLEHGCKACSMEVSSHSLDQQRVAALDYRVAIFTNLTGDHLDYHGTMENYAAAKAKLFEMLRPESTAVINADDPWHGRMVRGCRGRVLRCSTRRGPETDCWVAVREMSIRGTEASFGGPWGVIEGSTRLIGSYNVMNVLQALAAAHALGVERDEMALSLHGLRPPPGRLERVDPPEGEAPFAVFVDYAHTDDAMEKALGALRPLLAGTGGRLRVVFGCGGDRDRTKRPRMARAASRLADEVIVTSDNPRTEKPHQIISEILAGIETDEAMSRVHVDADRRAAIFRGVQGAQPGDIVLIAGKGHEDYQLLPDGEGGVRRIDFDDRRVAAEALHARLKPGAGAALEQELRAT